VLDEIGIERVHAVVGASYGGMVALAFGERYPDRVARLLVVSAADRAHPMASAWRVVQRRIVKFAIECGKPGQGLELARALAMATYRSPEEFAARFAGAPRRKDDERFSLPVEEYLFARGAEYAKSYRPESFVCLSESIDLHRVDATRIFVPVRIG
jgi:homoserine O-acetyltransferase